MAYITLMSCDTGSGIILKAENIGRLVAVSGGPGGQKKKKKIVDDFSFQFKAGKIYSIVGPSGSGKTSLLRLFNRLDESSSGNLTFHEQPFSSIDVIELRRKIALVFQIPFLFPGTVSENLFYGVEDQIENDTKSLGDLLSLVGLDARLAEQDPERLSVGQKQRIALARSLAMNPEILLLDEPTSALDPKAASVIEQLILKLNRELKLTIIIVTHNFQQAVRLGDYSLFLDDGRLIESGISSELFEHPTDELTRRYVKDEL